MIDDKFDPANQNWYKNRWNIDIDTTNHTYAISFDQYKDDGTNDVPRYAKNPSNSEQILDANETTNLDLSEEYGVTITNSCLTNKIFFDSIGRPYDDNTTYPATAPYQNLIQNPCTIVVTDGYNSETIEIKPETGYVLIQPKP